MSKVKTTETAYIVISDLTKLRGASQILSTITPMEQNQITLEEYHAMQKILEKWMCNLEKSIESVGL